MKTHKQIERGEEPRVRKRRPDLVDSWQEEKILFSLCVDIAIVDAYPNRVVFLWCDDGS